MWASGTVGSLMATLDAKKRASLPNSAFAYVDSKGNRRLPIHDEAHVRNALSRFNQVRFESDEAREKSFRRLLRAAAEYGIAPVGFVTRQIREAARSEEAAELPAGKVTLLFTDIEGSTGLVRELGTAYPELLEEVRRVIREAVESHGGYEVDARADEFFAAFARAEDAISAAVAIQVSMGARSWPGRQPKVRIGLHSGSPAVTDTGYVGLAVHVLARVASAGHGGQILITTAAREELGDPAPPGIGLTSLGRFLLHGLAEAEELLQVEAEGLDSAFPALRVAGPS